MAAIGLVIVAVPLAILAVSGSPGAIPAWRGGIAGATAAAIGGFLALAGRRRLPLARIVVLAYAASFSAEVVLARVVGRVSTSAFVEGSGSPAVRTAQAMSFSSTWAVVAYAAAGALGAVVATLRAEDKDANDGKDRKGERDRTDATATRIVAALTPSAGVVLGLLVAGLATSATLHLSTRVATRLAASLGAATATSLILRAARTPKGT